MHQNIEINEQYFAKANSLIYRQQTTHKIGNLQANEKSLQLKFMILQLRHTINTKKGKLYQYLVGDESGCALMNIFDNLGNNLNIGDICYVSGVYTSYFKQQLLIYQGSKSSLRRIGQFYKQVNLYHNISLSNN